jgi:hypothetical protein
VPRVPVPGPLTVTCDTCGASAETWDGEHPDRAVECGCCPLAHDHAGLGCRTVTITATARLTLLDAGDLLEAVAEAAWDAGFERRLGETRTPGALPVTPERAMRRGLHPPEEASS